jgi:hypothetical protein
VHQQGRLKTLKVCAVDKGLVEVKVFKVSVGQCGDQLL